MNRANKLKEETYYNLINTINDRIEKTCSIGNIAVSILIPYTFLEEITKHFESEGFIIKPQANYDDGILILMRWD